MADLAKFFALALIVPLIIAVAHCGKAGCNTVVQPAEKYRGSPTALEPYIEIGKLQTRIWHCDSFTCSVAVLIKPTVHNPLGKEIATTITCTYWIDDLRMDSRKLKPVLVPGQRSVSVEIHHGLSVLRQRGTVGVDCDADFSAVGFSTKEPINMFSDYAQIALAPPAITADEVHTEAADDATDLQDADL